MMPANYLDEGWYHCQMQTPPTERARFHRATDATAQDWLIIERAEAEWRRTRGAAQGLLSLLASIEHADTLGAPVNLYTHSLQAAARARSDGADDELVVVALFHDLPEAITDNDHGRVAASLLAPHLSERRTWLLIHHAAFQDFYFANHPTRNRAARDRHRGHPHYDETDHFCRCYDQNSFDPEFAIPPLATFAPIVRRFFGQAPLRSP
jgi:predicted HD phosphohydrolase